MKSSFLPLVHRPFHNVLIANRGEIAVRVIRACRDLGLSPLAIYSEADTNARHVALADKACCIGPGPSADSYLNSTRILEAAQKMGAQAVHPGFGFLSENAQFAQAVLEASLVWIGPSPAAIAAMGDKTVAKQRVQDAGVPCAPGKNQPICDVQDLLTLASTIGFPLILKATAGGGGRGMRVVRRTEELEEAFTACTREAQSYFGNPSVFCERYIEKPRHVEFQILADAHGHTVHLWERDCTIQRRHQKLIEEAPSSYISAQTRKRMGEVAIKAAQSVGYVNAGTVEFILDSPEQFYFMEMNTRIQVEHPVTEAITGIDLVQMQLRIAAGEPLPFTQDEIVCRGWAVEARINAEDPFLQFQPDVGCIQHVELPTGPGVRVDSHVYSGYTIPQFYDSLIAKLIVHGANREDALNRLRRALLEFHVDGIRTTIPYHLALLDNKLFRQGEYSTRFVEENPQLLDSYATRPLAAGEALVCALQTARQAEPAPPPPTLESCSTASQRLWASGSFEAEGLP